MSIVENVSLIFPVLNEVNTLPNSIDSILSSGYPKRNLELIIVDGGSTDGTLDYVATLKEKEFDVCLIENNKTLTAYAMNLGIKAAKHPILIRADAHAIYKKGYIEYSVESLVNGCGDNVGGVLVARPNTTEFSKVLAMVLNSKMGNGGASYRYADQGRLVDTVWCGCWYKELLIKVGMFNPKWVRNQDAELNARLLSSGMKVYSDPRIIAELIVRPTFKKFLSQYFGYGKGRIRTIFAYPKLIKLRQLLPVFGVIGLCLLVLSNFIIGALLLFSSVLVCCFYYYPKSKELNIKPTHLIWCLPIILGMNISWVAGCVSGISSILLEKKV